MRAIRRSFSSRAARVQKIVSKLLESFIETSPRSRIHERACGEREKRKMEGEYEKKRDTGGLERDEKGEKGWKIRRRDATTKEGTNYERNDRSRDDTKRIVVYREG